MFKLINGKCWSKSQTYVCKTWGFRFSRSVICLYRLDLFYCMVWFTLMTIISISQTVRVVSKRERSVIFTKYSKKFLIISMKDEKNYENGFQSYFFYLTLCWDGYYSKIIFVALVKDGDDDGWVHGYDLQLLWLHFVFKK